MFSLRIGGVPEHFNLPWHLLLESGDLARAGIEAQWRDFPDGSGAMAAALAQNEVDVAMLLTEGAVAGIAQGGEYHIVSAYTKSPLLWGIHVPADSALQSVADIRGATYAISRLGSGSHLMCFVHARRNNWPVEDLQFISVRSLQGAIDAFAANTAQVFFWEKFMTKPVVDAGIFRRIGEFAAPWPAFVVCASRSALADKAELIANVLRQVASVAAELAASSDGAQRIADRYGLRVEDVATWLGVTRWATHIGIDSRDLVSVVDTLQALQLVPAQFDSAKALAPLEQRAFGPL